MSDAQNTVQRPSPEQEAQRQQQALAEREVFLQENDRSVRAAALGYAVQVQGQGDPLGVLDTARAFLAFLTAQEPKERPQ